MLLLSKILKSKNVKSVFIKYYSNMNLVSKMFPPIRNELVTNSKSLSYQLMANNGIIFPQSSGMYTLLPLGVRSIEKLCYVLNKKLNEVNCQRLSLPFLTSASLWSKSGRLESSGPEILRLRDRNQQPYVLSPTHEEAITYMMSTIKFLSESSLPIRLYQITSKFRDEMRLKHGLLRSKEFLMKDLYTFDRDEIKAQKTFHVICEVYEDIFKTLGINVLKAVASVGSIGGTKSFEFHIPSTIGEDVILYCNQCNYVVNSELPNEGNTCPSCSSTNMQQVNGIEVGHSFLLGTKYSSSLSAYYKSSDNKDVLLQMGCYGIGVTRLLAAGIEILSRSDQLVWPKSLCPYKVCLIPPKSGSKDASNATWTEHLYDVISKIQAYNDEVIVDDRTKLTIGHRCHWAKNFGFPLIIVIGKSASSSTPLFEVIKTKSGEKLELTQCSLIHYLRENQAI